MKTYKRLYRHTLLTFAFVAASLGFVGTTASPVVAGSPIAYTQSGNHYTALRGLPSFSSSVVILAWLSPGEHFYMKCWLNNPNGGTSGNYPTTKWFWGTSKSHGSGYLNASYVYYQVWVPPC